MSSLVVPAESIYIIVGAPRSGTSALALVLREQGIKMYLGADRPDLDSPSGNQEDALARLLHNRLMGRNGLGQIHDWDNPRYVAGSDQGAIAQIQAYISCRYRNHSGCWGLKDPRLSFLIEPWYAATQALPTQWIHIYRREREAMVHSLIAMLHARLRHCGDSQALYHLAANWAEAYSLAIDLGFSRTGLQPFCLSYEELLTPEGQARLSAQFRFTLPIRCIHPELNRHGKRELAPYRNDSFRPVCGIFD
jgi:hypothetical protein